MKSFLESVRNEIILGTSSDRLLFNVEDTNQKSILVSSALRSPSTRRSRRIHPACDGDGNWERTPRQGRQIQLLRIQSLDAQDLDLTGMYLIIQITYVIPRSDLLEVTIRPGTRGLSTLSGPAGRAAKASVRLDWRQN